MKFKGRKLLGWWNHCPSCNKGDMEPYRQDYLGIEVTEDKREKMDRFVRCTNCGLVYVERWEFKSWKLSDTAPFTNKDFKKWKQKNKRWL